jgi:alkylation response protein AidB-like acyl-CoA dehydrogenase
MSRVRSWLAGMRDGARKEKEPACMTAVGRFPAGVVREAAEQVAYARRFNREVVRPMALEIDRRAQEDPAYLPWEMVEEANRWGFYTAWIPKLFGGKGWSLVTIAPVIEELSSQCVGIANLIGVQYFGLSILFASWNAEVADRVCREVVEGERTGKPCLVSGAVTEPEAGTDAEEVELAEKGKLTCHARKVKGGYVLNGRKVFISNGPLSTWHMVVAYEDTRRPHETAILLAVRNGMKGFSFGRMEKKMGQKACPAGELVFEDCFVPEMNVCVRASDAGVIGRTPKESYQYLIDFVVSLTRPGVGAMGAGVARGAFEDTLAFARETEVGGRPLVSREWAQCYLAEMYKNAALARLSYLECGFLNGLYGMTSLLNNKAVYLYFKLLPTSFFDLVMPAANRREAVTWMLRKLIAATTPDEDVLLTSGWASLSKFAATDLAVENCNLAVEFMGRAGVRHDGRVEKFLRDARLLQIYEGTNQLNRLNLFKCLIAPSAPEAEVFSD